MHRQGPDKIPSIVRIAKLTNGVVELDEERLKAISPESRSYPVAVVSVIGRSEDQRGAILKALAECLYDQATDDSCALISDKGERNDLDAIFAIFPPGRTTNEFGNEVAVLVLDISCPDYSSPAYSKLANMCLVASSVMIYTTSCNSDKVTNIEMSELKSVGPSILTKQMWIIVQDCDISVCSRAGSTRLPPAEHYEGLNLPEGLKEEILALERYSESSQKILMPKTSNRSEVAGDHHLMEDLYHATLKKVCWAVLKKATQVDGVILDFLVPYFKQKWCQVKAQVALADVNHSVETSLRCSYASAVKQPELLGHRGTTYSSRGRGRGLRRSQNYPNQCVSIETHTTSFKYDTKEMTSVDIEKMHMDSTDEMSGNEYEKCKNSEQRSVIDATAVDSLSMKPFIWVREKENGEFPDDVCVREIRRTDTETKPVDLTSCKEPLRESMRRLSGISLEKKDCTACLGQEPQSMEIDMSCEVIAENAAEYSLEHFAKLVETLTFPHSAFTVKDIKNAHEIASRHVLEAFSFQKLTPSFEKAKEKLQDTLSALLHKRLETNFAKMRKLDKKEEKLQRMCGMYYKDKMSSAMTGTTVSSQRAEEFHEEAVDDTKQWFQKQCKDVPELVKNYWDKVLDRKLEFWKSYYIDDYGVKQGIPRVTGFSLSTENENPSEKTSVGVYFGPDVVQFGLYSRDIEAFNQSCVEILPFISFKDEKIFIGVEAKNCGAIKYNVFDIISRPTSKNARICLKLYTKEFCLSSSEIAVLFFHEAKKTFESSVKSQVATCAVAASELLPSASKQGLISALKMSGFSIVKFIPSSTAILVWYLKWRRGQSYKNTHKDPRLLVIHHTGPLVEVVKAEISAGQHLKMREIGGFLNYNDFNKPDGGKVVQTAIREAISEVKGQSKDFEQVIMIHGSQCVDIIMERIQHTIGCMFDTAHCEERSNLHILFSAAAYDATSNGDESVNAHWPRFPDFNHLFPYKLSIRKNLSTITMEFPSLGSEHCFFTLRKGESRFTVYEMNRARKMLFCYPCSVTQVTRSSPKAKLEVTLRNNGMFNISGAPFTCPNFQFISDSDREYVKKQVAEVILEKDRFMEKSKGSCHIGTPEENAAEDLITLKASLRNQLEDVKQRLEFSTNFIKPMILEGINDRIKACEKLLSRRDVNEKQLSIAIGQLKVAANRIPSTN